MSDQAKDCRCVLHHGDALDWLRTLQTASADALATDPPAGIGFMNRSWDHHKGGRTAWIAWLSEILAEARRVLKPGAAGWVWALPRTSHWTATACEDAGFEVRDILVHLQGQGFPKSKALLKPASEHWILIRAPGPLQELRINECRVGTGSTVAVEHGAGQVAVLHVEGRWPANVALSHAPGCEHHGEKRVKGSHPVGKAAGHYEGSIHGRGGHHAPRGFTDSAGLETVEDWSCVPGCPVRTLGEQSGQTTSGDPGASRRRSAGTSFKFATETALSGYGDTGTAARFFHSFPAEPFLYVPKARRAERNAGTTKNHHPTVKPVKLLIHLIRLITPPGGLVIDPFAGSGTTGVAALREGVRFAGCEKEAEYVKIATERLAAAGVPAALPARSAAPVARWRKGDKKAPRRKEKA